MIFGIYKITRNVLGLLHMIYQYCILKFVPNNLYSRYGSKSKRSYVIVTGASDGIGLAISRELAKHGFGIILVARNLDKLKRVSETIPGSVIVQ